jgi:hypothetical protein
VKASVISALVLLALLGLGCGRDQLGPHVSQAEQQRLPTQEYALFGHVCTTLTEGSTRTGKVQRRGMRELRALIRALDEHPDAAVTATFSLADPAPGEQRMQREVISVRRLAETHLEPLGRSPCARRLKEILGTHLEGG